MESQDRFLFDILYYVLMTNHFHILLQKVGELSIESDYAGFQTRLHPIL